MKLEIITPDEKIFEGEASGVKVPGVNGSFEVLDHHAPLVSALEKGDVRINGQSKQELEIDGGVIEVLNNHVVILAEAVSKK